MSRVTLIGFLALLAAVAVAVFTPPTPLARIPGTTASSQSDPYAHIATDLKLVLDYPETFRIHPAYRYVPTGILVNMSRTREYPVLIPGDASEVGWTEPHTFVTGTLTRPNGQVVKLKPAQYGRCGNYNPD